MAPVAPSGVFEWGGDRLVTDLEDVEHIQGNHLAS